MAELHRERVYGERARIGLVVPSTNTVAEIEFWRMAPAGVTVHTSRMPFLPQRFDAPLVEMEKHVPRVLEEAASAEPDIIAYGCTASSATRDPSAYCAKLSQISGTETVTAAGVLLAALQALAVTRVALVTPYPPAVNAHEVSYFAQNGVQVLGDESVIVDDAQLQMRHMSRVPIHTLVSRAVALVSKHDVEGIVLSCCDLPTADAIAEIEAKTGLPVVSSAQALFWQSLRAAGISDAIDGYGQLLRNH